jgi:hypothetical protein
LRRGGNEDGHKAATERGFLLLGYGDSLAVLFGGRPALGDAVLQVNDGCARVSVLDTFDI